MYMALIPIKDDDELSLKDYDIHTLYLNERRSELELSKETRLELLQHETNIRYAVICTKQYKKNIIRLNRLFYNLTDDERILGKRAVIMED